MAQGKQSRKTLTTSAAVGLRAHSGWAALVVVAGSPRAPVVVDRRRIVLADPKIAGSRQPFHAAEPLELKKAGQLIRRCSTTSRSLARRALRAVLGELREKRHKVVGCGLLLASGRPVPALAAILASHALIHTAEGELFRDVLRRASRHYRLPVTEVRERELYTCAAAKLRQPADALGRRLSELGRLLGPPWSQDEKLAALVGWMALAAASRR